MRIDVPWMIPGLVERSGVSLRTQRGEKIDIQVAQKRLIRQRQPRRERKTETTYQEDVDTKVSTTSSLEENAERGENNGKAGTE